MKPQPPFLAFDLGAESGRAMAGWLDGERLRLEEVHRFPNGPVRLIGRLHWDAVRLFEEIKRGLSACAGRFGKHAAGIGLSAWGVDFALLDRQGELLGTPYCYRDPRTEGMPERVFERLPRRELFELTGIQFMPINTLYQLYATAVRQPATLAAAETLLMMPDLFNYWLTGRAGSELTIASTSQLCEARSRSWSRAVCDRLDLPFHILPPILPPDTLVGPLLPAIAEETGLRETGVIAPACHDTASAVAAVPLDGRDAAFISSGTWSALGAEVAEPVIDARSLDYNFTNECGVDGRYNLRKNIMGLWLLQQCRQTWASGGTLYEYDDLMRLAEQAEPATALIEPDYAAFLQPGECRRASAISAAPRGSQRRRSVGEIARCILASLALKYRWALECLDDLTGRRAEVVHVVGGGSKNTLLCQWTADAAQRPVLAGPAEATVTGNILAQAIAGGRLSSVEEGRRLIRRSGALIGYEPHPRDRDRWEELYGRFLKLRERTPTLM